MTLTQLFDAALQIVSAASGVALALWIFWRVNETRARGEAGIKALLLCMFAAAVAWVVDQVAGNDWSWDGAALLACISTYVWWGAWRHRHADRRHYRAPPGCPVELAPPSCPVGRKER